MENKTPQPEKKSEFHFSIPMPNLEWPDLTLTKPKDYACIILRVLYGQYFILPHFFINNINNVPEKLPNVFRLIVSDEIKFSSDNEQMVHKLKGVLFLECLRQRWQGCLALNQMKGIYYFPAKNEFIESNKIPSHSQWLSEIEFLNYRQQEIDSGKLNPNNSPLQEIYFIGSKQIDSTLTSQLEAKGYNLAITRLSEFIK